MAGWIGIIFGVYLNAVARNPHINREFNSWMLWSFVVSQVTSYFAFSLIIYDFIFDNYYICVEFLIKKN